MFLAAFSGLYFAVFAVTDETYRREFFTEVLGELEQALRVRVALPPLGRPSHRPEPGTAV